LFWFGDYQGMYRSFGASQLLGVPTAAERGGNLSDWGVVTYDPNTGGANGAGRTPFSGTDLPGGIPA
jgi:hypothetical protein